MARLMCPNCGASFKLPNHSELTLGVTLSRENEGDHYMKMDGTFGAAVNKGEKRMNKAEERREKLANAGIDMTMFFELNGDLYRLLNGSANIVDDDMMQELLKDSFAESILNTGYVDVVYTHRRWVMAQMFDILRSMKRNNTVFAAEVNKKGYDYQWHVLVHKDKDEFKGELKTLAKMEGSDDTYKYEKRALFFSMNSVFTMLDDYEAKLIGFISKMKHHKCHGEEGYIEYVDFGDYRCTGVRVPSLYRLHNGDQVFVKDINKKVLKKIHSEINHVKASRNYTELMKRLYWFVKSYMIKLPYNTPMSVEFIETYKGAGAAYTLENMIIYHNCILSDYRYGNKYIDIKNSLNYMWTCAQDCHRDFYRLFALLKRTIEENNYDFYEDMRNR